MAQRSLYRSASYGMDDARIRQIFGDLIAPLTLQISQLRQEISDIRNAPKEAASNRRNDILIICTVLGTLIAVSTCGSSVLAIAVQVFLAYRK